MSVKKAFSSYRRPRNSSIARMTPRSLDDGTLHDLLLMRDIRGRRREIEFDPLRALACAQDIVWGSSSRLRAERVDEARIDRLPVVVAVIVEDGPFVLLGLLVVPVGGVAAEDDLFHRPATEVKHVVVAPKREVHDRTPVLAQRAVDLSRRRARVLERDDGPAPRLGRIEQQRARVGVALGELIELELPQHRRRALHHHVPRHAVGVLSEHERVGVEHPHVVEPRPELTQRDEPVDRLVQPRPVIDSAARGSR